MLRVKLKLAAAVSAESSGNSRRRRRNHQDCVSVCDGDQVNDLCRDFHLSRPLNQLCLSISALMLIKTTKRFVVAQQNNLCRRRHKRLYTRSKRSFSCLVSLIHLPLEQPAHLATCTSFLFLTSLDFMRCTAFSSLPFLSSPLLSFLYISLSFLFI